MFHLLNLFYVKLSFYGVMIPPLLNSTVNYFVYDLEDESFLMPRPMMCVELFSQISTAKMSIRMINNKPLIQFQGCHSIGRRHQVTWLLGFSNRLDFCAHFFQCLASTDCTLVHVGYSNRLQKILQMICLN